MRKIILYCGVAIAVSACVMTHFLRDKSEFDTPYPAISCKGEVHFSLQLTDTTLTAMNGNISIITLGTQRLALHYSGRLKAKEGIFFVNRTLLMNYLYHPENHVMELTYAGNHASTLDTVPDALFYRTLVRSDTFLMRVAEVGDRLLLFSSPESPQFMCVRQ